MSCFICDKHLGDVEQPPGGYIYEDEHWKVCHFPVEQSVIGQLIIESKRHFLDFADMTDDEASTYGYLVKRLYSSLKQVTGAERIYSLVTIEGVPHFHVHLVPRMKDSDAKGVAFLFRNNSCSHNEAVEMVRQLRACFEA